MHNSAARSHADGAHARHAGPAAVPRLSRAAAVVGCCAGEEAPLRFSLYYAPPEVVEAYDAGCETTPCAAAADVWALGVRIPPFPLAPTPLSSCPSFLAIVAHSMVYLASVSSSPGSLCISMRCPLQRVCAPVQVICWELLTKQRFYGARARSHTVIAQLAGRAALPTEVDICTDLCRRLGGSRICSTILAMLSRAPDHRPAVGDLLQQWKSVFSGADMT